MRNQLVTTFIAALATTLSVPAECQIQFENVTNTAGDFHVGESWGSSWGDLNSDGLPDLYVGNHRELPSVYRNNGNGTFTNVISQVDVSQTWSNRPLADLHGGTWADFDRDGDQDLFVATGTCCQTQLFENQSGVLVDKTSALNIPDDGGGRMGNWFDYNLDGRLDIAIMNSGTSKLVKQKSDGTFVVVGNNSSGFKCTQFRSNYTQLSDINDDIGSGGAMEVMCMQDGTSPKKVYDTSSFPFQDITNSVPSFAPIVDTITGDFDGDLLPDMFMVRGSLRHNQAVKVNNKIVEARIQGPPGTDKVLSFSASGNITVEFDSRTLAKQGDTSRIFIGSNGTHPGNTTFVLNPNNNSHHGVKSHNPNNNHGLYIGLNTSSNEWEFHYSTGNGNSRGYFIITSANTIGTPNLSPLKGAEKPIASKLLVNGVSGLNEEAAAHGLNEKIKCVAATTGDFDNDMDLDLYLVCRGGAENIANILFENQGNGNFVKVTNAGEAKGKTGSAITDGAGTGESVSTADYDVDGFLDLYVTNGLNMQPLRVGGPDQLFHNLGNSNNWIELDLKGTTSNADGIGAKVYATAGGITQLREQTGGYHRWSQDHQRLHFGLAPYNSVNLTIYWPNGAVDHHNNVSANALYRATENGSIQKVTINTGGGPQPGDECGKPSYSNASPQALYIWKDCPNGKWHLRAVGGSSPSLLTYAGDITSDSNFNNVTVVSLEGADIVNTSDPKRIDYVLKMKNKGFDGFDFNVSGSAQTCFDPSTVPSNASVKLGGGKTQMSGSFDLNTLGACTN